MGVGAMASFAQRAAINTIVQGGSADIIKKAMIDVFTAYRGTPVQMTMQVHDELIVEAPEEEAQKAAQIVSREMENACEMKVRLKSDANIGKTWYDAKG